MKTIAFLTSILLLPLVAIAQDGVDAGPPLTKAKAESFVACLAEIYEFEEKYASDESLFEDGDEDESEDWASMVASMKTHPAYEEMMAVLNRNGFDGPEDWIHTSARFISAYSAVKMGDSDVDMQAEMREAIDAINENEMLTDEQKDEMIEMMKAQQGVLEMFRQDVSEAEMNAVRAVIEEFEALSIEEEDDEYDEY